MPLLILPNASGDAITNMAIDASLLRSISQDIAVFRHYEWIEPAATFGYNQRWLEAASLFSNEVRLCRRITGGGIVDHRNDWTYALAIKFSWPAAQTNANTLYKQIHRSLAEAVRKMGIETKLAPCPCRTEKKATGIPDQCFVTPAANDVLTTNGIKVAGAAMKRTREGTLIQGSVDRTTLPQNFDYSIFTRNFAENLSNILEIPIGHSPDIRSICHESLIQSERERFKSKAWTQKR